MFTFIYSRGIRFNMNIRAMIDDRFPKISEEEKVELEQNIGKAIKVMDGTITQPLVKRCLKRKA